MSKNRKIIRYIITCAVFIALCLWAYMRWDSWFNNPDEPHYVASMIPSRVLLTFGNENGINRNVSWQCDSVLLPSHVEIEDVKSGMMESICASGELYESQGGKTAYYVAKFRNLKSGHNYKYRVCTDNKYSEWYKFKTQENEKSTSFIYVGDIQDTIAGIANKLIKGAFRNNPDAEFLVCGGDLIERPLDCYWNEMFQTLDSIGQSIPVLTITGNHDYHKGIICTLDHRFSLVNSYYQDSKVGDNQVFTVKYGDVQLFAIDSNREFFYLWKQKYWLKQQLDSSKAKWKIVLVHHPLYSIRGCMNNIIQRWMFDDIIRDNGVDLVLQGHEHAYARMINHDNKGKLSTPVYTVSHCSPKNYLIEFDDKFDKFGSGSRYYQKVRNCGDTLFVTAYNAFTGALYDSLQIIKNSYIANVVDLGKNIPEVIEFTPHPDNVKDKEFVERIAEYKNRKSINK